MSKKKGRSLISSLLYPAPPASYSENSFPDELLWMPQNLNYATCPPGGGIPGILLRCHHAKFLLMYLHSNAEDIGTARHFGCGMRMLLGMHVFLVEYPGYGIYAGESSEDALEATADLAFRYLTKTLSWPAEDIIGHGPQLGCIFGTRLACNYAFHGLVLVSPFLSLVEAVSEHLGAIAQLVLADEYRNKDLISRVQVPTLIIHALNDKLVPVRHGKELHQLCPQKRKLLVCPQYMGHNGDILRDANLLIHPMLRLFSLPDYSLTALQVPPEAFDKRLCVAYHAVFEAAREASPLKRNFGDQGDGLEGGNDMDGPRCIHQGHPQCDGDLAADLTAMEQTGDVCDGDGLARVDTEPHVPVAIRTLRCNYSSLQFR